MAIVSMTGVSGPDGRARHGAGPVLLGAAAVAAALLLGVVVGHGPTALDEAVRRALGRWCDQPACRDAADLLSAEIGWPFTVSALVVLPLLVAAGVLLATRGADGRRARALAVRVLVAIVLAAAAQEVLSRLYGRVGPVADPAEPPAAYPSGAALLVVLTWVGAGLVVTSARPAWRVAWWVATVDILIVHAVVRVTASKHWATDIAGSYLLAAGALTLARWLRFHKKPEMVRSEQGDGREHRRGDRESEVR
jgi:hypothetical protein